ncbi:CheR family methyltransferase [Deinococcus humi]|uniref:protein-glutamate O-methyltransferase n=1 Tax=Deinococcus humi TaxID=662880 RepID=A0A7W8NFU5_9DEIO|nr:CheR family methyltransferase [Deinococcus humi]MBB5363118.1 two-component system CheB/CheR fusion protein [Deinococcus humi]GGO24594.1 chemotaxis protein CheR [Deinococcus humi]
MSDDQRHPPRPVQSSSSTSGGSEVAPTPPQLSAVVGIGGSAGALDGYERFFLGLPLGGALAFVVVAHLSPNGESLMPDLLRRCTSLPVVEIEEGMRVEPDHVYVAPGGFSPAIMNGTLLLRDLETAQGRTIDAFLSSLAADQGKRAVAVILSGMGDDGQQGVRAVSENLGLVLAQDPASADYPAMPTNAIATGVVLEVLPPAELAPRLHELVTRTRLLQSDPGAVSTADLQKILHLVRERSGQDFSRYKVATLLRRVDRRMQGQRLVTLPQYLQYLKRHPDEIDALFDDLTINVTSFFRDPEAFEHLKNHLRDSLTRPGREGEAIRAWVVGCASGEEAYSLAIVLHELTQEPGWAGPTAVQVFATDIDPRSIEKARLGLYPRSIKQNVTPERLKQYFTETGDGYQISNLIRDMIVFARHNTFGDPPFTALDLLCCRNMLIYLNSELQKRVLSVFHYALRPGALLFLGASETIGPSDEKFEAVESRWRIYRRGPGAAGALPVEALLSGVGSPRPLTPPVREGRPVYANALPQHVQRLLLATYAPAAVVVNAQGDILYVNGRTSRYLELPSGMGGISNVLDMSRDGLRFELSTAMRRVLQERRAVTLRDVGHGDAGAPFILDVTVQPIHPPEGQADGDTLLIAFQERPAEGITAQAAPEQVDQVQALTRELHHLRETLQMTSEEHIISTEELRSTNEEYQTTIEELKSTNEELLTSKEELQSLNEELITTNAEHRGIIQNLTQAQGDMKNLLESAGIATLFLGNDLRIKRFTPQIDMVINLLQTDIGRHIGDINVRLRDVDFGGHVAQVLETLLPFEAQVQTPEGHWHLMRVTPYRTSDNFIDGAVVTFTNIDAVKSLEARLDHSELYSEALLNAVLIPTLVFDDDLRLVTANRALYSLLQVSPEQARGQRLADLGRRQLDLWELRERLMDMVLTDTPLTQYVIDLNAPGVGMQKTKVEAWPVLGLDGTRALHLLMLEDITAVMQRAAQAGETFTGDAEDPLQGE